MKDRALTKKEPAARADRGHLIQRTYERLRDGILHQRLRPGVKLTAEHLAAMLEVSRTPVRQALERLYQEGYVVQIPSRGFFVAEIDSIKVRDKSNRSITQSSLF